MADIHVHNDGPRRVDDGPGGWNGGMLTGLAIGLILLVAVAFLIIARPWSGGGLVDTNGGGSAPTAPIQRNDNGGIDLPGRTGGSNAPAGNGAATPASR